MYPMSVYWHRELAVFIYVPCECVITIFTLIIYKCIINNVAIGIVSKYAALPRATRKSASLRNNMELSHK